MIWKTRSSDDPNVDLTPLIDVVFLLLIFFMVSTTFNRETKISVDLPEASGEKLKIEKVVIEISIDSQGRYFVNQQLVTDNRVVTLKRAIRTALKEGAEPQVIISGDKGASYEAAIRAMDAARQLGLTNINLATKQAEN